MRHEPARRLRVLTWQVHANYMYYLSQVPCQWFLATRPGQPPGYGGRGRGFVWGDNVHEIDCAAVAQTHFDAVLYQSRTHWEHDRFALLSPAQRALPAIYLEHDPPRQHPTDTRHWAQDASLLVHVTPFNRLMWDNGAAATWVIEHAAHLPVELHYDGRRPEGITVVNHLANRGRRLGADVYLALQRRAPLVLVGMGSEQLPGGLGEIVNWRLPSFMAGHRYLFNPIRWTSLGLSVVEAMTLGMPVVGLATTELVSVIDNGRNGWLSTEPDELVEVMRRLSADTELARRWGAAARETALSRFSMQRFRCQWLDALEQAVAAPNARPAPPAVAAP